MTEHESIHLLLHVARLGGHLIASRLDMKESCESEDHKESEDGSVVHASNCQERNKIWIPLNIQCRSRFRHLPNGRSTPKAAKKHRTGHNSLRPYQALAAADLSGVFGQNLSCAAKQPSKVRHIPQ